MKLMHKLKLILDFKVGIFLLLIMQFAVLTYLVAAADIDYQKFQNIFTLACFFMTIFACIFGFFGVCAIIKVIALENSTHEIEYVPIDHKKAQQEQVDYKKQEEEFAKAHKDILEDDFFPDEVKEL